MPWSNMKIKNPVKGRGVLTKDAAAGNVLEFVPFRFDLGTPEQALQYLEEKKNGSDFQMDDSIRAQTGVDQLEVHSEEGRIEEATLEKLKDVQEEAYKEAYALGLEEGRKEAFNKWSTDIKDRMDTLDQLLITMKSLKKEMASFNESYLIELMFQMASRLARTQLIGNHESMIRILRDAVALAHDEENVRVRISPSQFEFLEGLKKETGREFEFIKKIRFEPSMEISAGGCVVETNYGEIDSRIEQRVEQLWTVMTESSPKVKDRISG